MGNVNAESNVEQLKKDLNEFFDPQVYYDPRTRCLFTVKSYRCGRVIIGGGCCYYGDAITSLGRYSISDKYFKECFPITRDSDYLEDGVKCVKGIPGSYFYELYHNKEFEYVDYANDLIRANSDYNYRSVQKC